MTPSVSRCKASRVPGAANRDTPVLLASYRLR
jgi:hypothetical protein